jgi:hypothetical protein
VERLPALRDSLVPADRKATKALKELGGQSRQLVGRIQFEEEIASTKVDAIEEVGHSVISSVARLGRHAAMEIEQAPYLAAPISHAVEASVYAMTEEINRLGRRLR